MKIKHATAIYTGGGVYIYYGQLEDGNYFRGCDGWDFIEICNADTSIGEADYVEFYTEHSIKTLTEEDYKLFWNKILLWIIHNTPDGNYSVTELENRIIEKTIIEFGSLQLKKDGYVYISNRGIEYELLEGVGIGGRKCTSDIIFICLMNAEYNVDDMIVGYLYGAMLFEDDLSGYEESIKTIVEEYEKRNFGLNKIIAALNEKMEMGYDKAQLEVDYGEIDECEGYYISKINGWGVTPVTPILATENDIDDNNLIVELDVLGIAYCLH